MIKIFDNVLDKKETEFLCNTFLNNTTPYYLNKGQTDNDIRFHFTHVLQNRDTEKIMSKYYYDVLTIINNICKKTKTKLNKTLRACVNLTFPYTPSQGAIHLDHSFDHKQFIICLTNGGATLFFNKKDKVIKKINSKKFRVLLFDKQKHAVLHSKEGVRAIIVVTFV
jgi:hypothetical protein|tara:strand:- start:24 stop:524 length:501 start_codon:yes stop_codon:yes gene_type:complete